MQEPKIILECVKKGSKLRIRFHSFINEEGKEYTNVYSNAYNCQFPKAIRKEGCFYEVGAHDISLNDRGHNQAFYTVRTANIRILNELPKKPETVLADIKTFALTECVICMAEVPDQIFLPCGHICTCTGCYTDFKTRDRHPSCPLCRREVTNAIHSSALIQQPVVEKTEKVVKAKKVKKSDVADEEDKTTTTTQAKKRKNLKEDGEETVAEKPKRVKKVKETVVDEAAEIVAEKPKRGRKVKVAVADQAAEIVAEKPKRGRKVKVAVADEAVETISEKPKKVKETVVEVEKTSTSTSQRPVRQTKKNKLYED